MKQPELVDLALTDYDAERVRRSHHQAIKLLQKQPAATSIQNIVLEDGVITPIAHGLQRLPIHISVSPVRGAASAGLVQEIRTTSFDRAQYVVLEASDFGADVTVDLLVY